MIELTRRYELPAAHVLASPALSEEENRRIFGRCANPGGHGHNYWVEVTLTGPVDEVTGEIIPLDLLDEIFDTSIRSRYGHRMLNELERYALRVPTAENIVKDVYGELAPEFERRSGARLLRVKLTETPNNRADYGEEE
ncbi:MAG: 6-carboxytetrahydropterin synthase [Deltaproteobacteria bacterium]|nr:6-carboxytetrahydropterin synthase [Deltaproteobacteria bacterium]MBW2417638.1 6-carboxytetrahydropterin synthase [Deltaproteobacteria bacterium]